MLDRTIGGDFYLKKMAVGGVFFSYITIHTLLDELEYVIRNMMTGRVISTVNTDILLMSRKDSELMDIINNSWITTADGMPIIWLSALSRNRLPQRVTGADITYRVCVEAPKRGFRPFFFGAAPGIAETAKQNVEKLIPDLDVAGVYSPSPFELENSKLSMMIVEEINKSGANILFVALGAPKQERWIQEYKDFLNVSVSIGVGASIDFLAGSVPRAPLWIQKVGFEWVYRLFKEPKRLWRRYLRDLRIADLFFEEIKAKLSF